MIDQFHYEIEECEKCGQLVSANWAIRHKRGGCKGGSVLLKQLVLAQRDGRLPHSVKVVAQPAEQTYHARKEWERAAQKAHNVKLVWLALEDYVTVYVGYNVETRTLVIGHGVLGRAVTSKRVVINE